MTPMLILAGVGFVLVLAAWGMWALVRSWDRTNAVVAAAPELPIRMLNVWDSVWLRGEIECPEPVTIPQFGRTALHYDYKLEQWVTRTRVRDGKTETYSQWETVKTLSDLANFSVRQDDELIAVSAADALWHYESSDVETYGVWRHTCTYTPCPGMISVIGVVGEKKQVLQPLQHVPLIVTQRDRASYLEAAESAERKLAGAGSFFLLAGFTLLVFGLVRYVGTKARPQDDWWHAPTGVVALLSGLGAVALFWLIRTYNSLVTYRTRAEQSWSGIDVLLKQRYDVIPNLVEVVKGYAGYEAQTLEHLTNLRTRALADRKARVQAESDVLDDLNKIAILAESYPDLRANDQYRILAKHLTALEDKIAHARGFYSDSVAEYNTHLAQFPANIVASLFGFGAYPLFAAELQEKAAPRFEL